MNFRAYLRFLCVLTAVLKILNFEVECLDNEEESDLNILA
jgi:hypothetical protein